MRRDVKIGVVLSLVVVLVAGWYYLRRSPEDEAIPLGVELASSSPAAQEPSSESAVAPQESAAAQAPTPVRRAEEPVPERAAPGQTPPPAKPEPSPPPDRLFALDDSPQEGPAAGSSLKDLLQLGPAPSGTEEPGETEDIAVAPPPPEPKAASATPDTTGRRIRSKPARRPAHRGPAPAPITRSSQPTRAPAPGTRTHRVERGDTFSILAEVYYGSQQHTGFLVRANPQVKDPNRLLVGTVLNVPPLGGQVRTAAAASPTPKGTYRVKEGDSFYGIARDVLGDSGRWQELLALNRELVDGDPQKLRAGQLVKLPPAGR